MDIVAIDLAVNGRRGRCVGVIESEWKRERRRECE
jgi:hypothetical protein